PTVVHRLYGVTVRLGYRRSCCWVFHLRHPYKTSPPSLDLTVSAIYNCHCRRPEPAGLSQPFPAAARPAATCLFFGPHRRGSLLAGKLQAQSPSTPLLDGFHSNRFPHPFRSAAIVHTRF